ncbi:response regulator [Pseudomonas stutzeri]|nr:response regulator [Stutzerimonas stutzeri]
MPSIQPAFVLIAEDDPDDRLLLRDAFRDSRLPNALQFAEDGRQLLDYLQANADRPLPGLILLDLNMPRLNGRETLQALKADPLLRRIPVVVFSTASCEEEIQRCRSEGAEDFISKPSSYSALLDVVRRLGDHWLDTAPLPPEPHP